jgi:hypothetical protein
MELQDFGPVAQSKEIFTQGVSSKMESDKLIGIALVVLISGVAIGYVYWQEHKILLSKTAPSKELKS